MAKAIGKWLIVGHNGLVTHQATHWKVKWFSTNQIDLVLQQLAYAVTAKNTKVK